MAELRQIAEAVEAEKRGVLSNDRRAALQEIRNRAAGSKKTLINYIEPLLAIGSAAIAEPVSGFVGMAGLPFGVDAASSAIKRTQDAMTYQPRTQGGKEVMQDIGNLIAPVVEPLQRGAEWMGDTTLDVTGSPALATAVRTGIEVAPDLVGGKILSNIPGRKLEAGDLAASGGQMGRQRGAVAGNSPNDATPAGRQDGQSDLSDNVNDFREWFGDSKVVDESGAPLVVYHGSDSEFMEYDLSRTGSGASERGALTNQEQGIYAVDVERHAEQYGEVSPLYVKMENPYFVDFEADLEAWAKEGEETGEPLTAQELVDRAYSGDVYNATDADSQFEQHIKAAKRSGNDGVIADFGNLQDSDVGRLGRVYIVFKPEQIKTNNTISSGQIESD